jgi:hypothetical protein
LLGKELFDPESYMKKASLFFDLMGRRKAYQKQPQNQGHSVFSLSFAGHPASMGLKMGEIQQPPPPPPPPFVHYPRFNY